MACVPPEPQAPSYANLCFGGPAEKKPRAPSRVHWPCGTSKTALREPCSGSAQFLSRLLGDWGPKHEDALGRTSVHAGAQLFLVLGFFGSGERRSYTGAVPRLRTFVLLSA